ncbi:Clp protease [Tissierella creatinini]|nr:Clp protease [Tissierella creatinini]TJX69142.1 Clp protease [Soehngenia saccharolytica]
MDEETKQDIEQELENNDTIKDFGIPGYVGYKKNIQFISLIGEIEGHYVAPSDKKTTKYEHIIPLLIGSQQDPSIEGLFIILNTVGGDVEAGLALAELINGINKPKVSIVLGGGHSIGVPLATSTDYSVIVPSATMTIHPIRTTGLVVGGPQTFRYFQKMQQRINNFILRTSKIREETLIELMYATDQLANDVGTILVGDEAVKYGLIDSVGNFTFALEKLNELIENTR